MTARTTVLREWTRFTDLGMVDLGPFDALVAFAPIHYGVTWVFWYLCLCAPS